jgi:hypothetical protein
MHFGIRAHSIKLPVSPRPIGVGSLKKSHTEPVRAALHPATIFIEALDVAGTSTPEGQVLNRVGRRVDRQKDARFRIQDDCRES